MNKMRVDGRERETKKRKKKMRAQEPLASGMVDGGGGTNSLTLFLLIKE
jgi:hypothetical protein